MGPALSTPMISNQESTVNPDSESAVNPDSESAVNPAWLENDSDDDGAALGAALIEHLREMEMGPESTSPHNEAAFNQALAAAHRSAGEGTEARASPKGETSKTVVFDSSWSPFSGSTLELAAQPPRLGKGLELASFGAPNRGGQRATPTAHSSVMKRVRAEVTAAAAGAAPEDVVGDGAGAGAGAGSSRMLQVGQWALHTGADQIEREVQVTEIDFLRAACTIEYEKEALASSIRYWREDLRNGDCVVYVSQDGTEYPATILYVSSVETHDEQGRPSYTLKIQRRTDLGRLAPL